MPNLNLESVQNFLTWARIEKDGFIEVNSYCFINGKYVPQIHCYTNKLADDPCSVVHVATQYSGTFVTVGINPRPLAYTGRCAKDSDIQIYKNVYLDIEPVHAPHTNVTEHQQSIVTAFLSTGLGELIKDEWHPVFANSGNGWHILIAIPPYGNPQEFGNKLQTWYTTILLPQTSALRYVYRVRIDSTFSPSRQVKLYGTKKPIEGARLSSFPAVARIESAEFRDYILSFPEKTRTTIAVGTGLQASSLTREAIEQKYGLRQ